MWCYIKICSKYSSGIRHFASVSKLLKVTLCGAAGPVGQNVALMLKQSPYVEFLALYDRRNTKGLAMELAQMDTACRVMYYDNRQAQLAFKDSSVCVLAVGGPAATYHDLDTMFEDNASKVCEIVKLIAKYCPNALIAIASSPVDSMVPVATEIMKQCGKYNAKKIFGITSLNVIRANAYAAEALGFDSECTTVPVIGGNVTDTVVPVLSQAKPCNEFTMDELERITDAIQYADDNMIPLNKKEGAPLAMAFAIARFVISLIRGLKGIPNVVECTYIRTDLHPLVQYLALPVLLGPVGIQSVLGIPKLSAYEQCMFDRSLPKINERVEDALCFLDIEVDVCDVCDGSKPPKVCENPCDKMAKGVNK